MHKNLYVYAVLMVLAIGSWWFFQASTETSSGAKTEPLRGSDYFSTGYSKIEMDANGIPKNKVIADRVVHYTDNDSTELDNPVMTIYKTDAPDWVIRSETGIVPAGGRDMFLNGKVYIQRAKAKGKKPIIINSSNMRVKPEQDYAETDEWAELIMPPNRTTGVGMQANFGEPLRIKLLTKVRGNYE